MFHTLRPQVIFLLHSHIISVEAQLLWGVTYGKDLKNKIKNSTRGHFPKVLDSEKLLLCFLHLFIFTILLLLSQRRSLFESPDLKLASVV